MRDSLSFLLVMLFFVLFAIVQGSRRKLELKLDAIVIKLNAISEHLKIAPSDMIPAEVTGLLQAGRKIEAIKRYREATGAGLAEAKTAVERIEAGMIGSSGRISQP
jgi:ribosomal protein L7/L12